jgi:neutral ceramidase
MKLPAKSLLHFVALILGLLAAGLGILSLPWVKARPVTTPRIAVIARGSGPLLAGVGVAPIDVPLGAPIAGFPHLGYRSDGADPVTARAVVLVSGELRLAVVSAEILLVPDTLRDAVLSRLQGLQLTGVILAATHTHASPGGYYENLAAERVGMGPYDPRMRDLVANAMAEAVRRALADVGPARLSVGRGRDTTLVAGRGGAPPDGRLTVLRLDRSGGQPLAEVAVFGAHATTLGIRNRRISGDWPARFYAAGRHGVRLLLQGAVGDQRTNLPQAQGPLTPESYAAAVDRAVASLAFTPPDPMPALAFAAAEVDLPTPEPPAVPVLLRQAATNLVSGILPARAQVSALRAGPVILVDVPGEVMHQLADRWRGMAGPGAEVVSLADGYLGYVDAPELSTGAQEHAERTYYGPGLAPALERGLSMTVAALREADKPVASPSPPAEPPATAVEEHAPAGGAP